MVENGRLTVNPKSTVAISEDKMSEYSGQVDEDGFRNGFGRCLVTTGGLKGQILEGSWKDNILHGFARIIFTSGEVFEGEIRRNRPHGQGKKIYPDGSEKLGKWINGKYIDF